MYYVTMLLLTNINDNSDNNNNNNNNNNDNFNDIINSNNYYLRLEVAHFPAPNSLT